MRTRFSTSLYIFVSLLLLSIAAPIKTIQAQYFSFGKNKVQYQNFKWKYIQSEHFDVYFTTGGEYLAKFTADAAENAYRIIRRDFRHEINNRIAIIVFKSHNDFQQNNVIKQYLGEGVGGVTELYKNRVVIPYQGDYRTFRHVIHHELIHAVINDMIYGGSLQNAIVNNIRANIPLWFNEGLAEFESLEWDTNSDMFISDAVLNTYLPEISQLGGYFAYRGGQSVFRYIEKKYGREKIGEIMQRLRASRNVDLAFNRALGLDVKELSEKWQNDLKIIHWPEIAHRENINNVLKKLTDHEEDGSSYNTSPSISPQGDKFAFITDKSGYFEICIGSTIEKDKIYTIASSQSSRDFEQLKILTPGITWSPDGNKIALATKAGESDAIVMIDIEDEETEKLTFDLDGIFSVSWSPNGKSLTFVGSKDYESDIYVYDLKSKRLTNLTQDVYSDADPSWSPDSKTIYFSSDRTNNLKAPDIEPIKMQMHDYSQSDLYAYDLLTQKITRLTSTEGVDESSPLCAPDGKSLLFISDLNGVYNIYKLDLSNPTFQPSTDGKPGYQPLTNLLTGIRSISISRDGSKLLGVGLDKAGFDVYMLRMPLNKKLPADHLTKNGQLIKTLWGENMVQTRTKHFSIVTNSSLKKEEKEKTYPKVFSVDNAAMNMAFNQADTTEATPTVQKDTTSAKAEPKKGYENVELDLKNFVFDKNFVESFNQEKKEEKKEQKPQKEQFGEKLDEEGEYQVKKYKLSFSPDIIYGAAQYDALYGASGAALFSFSDLLGNHNFTLFTNLQIDLQNSDYGITYYYLPHRINYGISAFHQARYLTIEQDDGYDDFFRYRIYGGTLMASYPLNRFKRLDFGFSFLNLSKENLDRDLGNETTSFLYPSLSYIHDNTLSWLYAPLSGTRYGLSLSGTYGSKVKFGTVLADYRTYMNFWKYYSFAVRFSGATSFGETPQKFFIGGTQNWINRKFENDAIPVKDIQDFIFTTPAIPLRGYNYNVANGNNFALANLELRFPFMQYLAFGPVPIPFYYVEGVMFTDLGSAWNKSDFRGTNLDENGHRRLNDLYWGYGWGIRTVLLYFIIRFDMAWANDWSGSSKPTFYISLGSDF